MMVVIDLVKDCLIYLSKTRTNIDLVKAVQSLADADLLRHVGDAAVQVIDDYMTNGAEDLIYLEPEFQKTNDLNAFLSLRSSERAMSSHRTSGPSFPWQRRSSAKESTQAPSTRL